MKNTIGSRIVELRKHTNLTQQEFADRIGCSRAAVGKYETDVSVPLNPIITAICREFNVSESWLRTGEGDMFVSLSLDQSMAMAWGRMMAGRDDAAERRKAFVGALLEMPPEMLDSLYDAFKAIVERFEGEP